RAGEDHETPYKVAGPLCDGGDVYFDVEGLRRLPDHRLLPDDVSLGEVLALLNCGAYSLSQASQYNGRSLPTVILIRVNGQADVIRKRDTLKDLVLNEAYCRPSFSFPPTTAQVEKALSTATPADEYVVT